MLNGFPKETNDCQAVQRSIGRKRNAGIAGPFEFYRSPGFSDECSCRSAILVSHHLLPEGNVSCLAIKEKFSEYKTRKDPAYYRSRGTHAGFVFVEEYQTLVFLKGMLGLWLRYVTNGSVSKLTPITIRSRGRKDPLILPKEPL